MKKKKPLNPLRMSRGARTLTRVCIQALLMPTHSEWHHWKCISSPEWKGNTWTESCESVAGELLSTSLPLLLLEAQLFIFIYLFLHISLFDWLVSQPTVFSLQFPALETACTLKWKHAERAEMKVQHRRLHVHQQTFNLQISTQQSV